MNKVSKSLIQTERRRADSKAKPEMPILTTSTLELEEELESQEIRRAEPVEATGEIELIRLTSKARPKMEFQREPSQASSMLPRMMTLSQLRRLRKKRSPKRRLKKSFLELDSTTS